MKQLERFCFVQYFLYEREDFEIGKNTAFLGPNGTGKTALLDALQIVMLAADNNRIHFNASGEGKKRARSLREYCLGVYGQTDDARCRDTANTYIDLVFRDALTGAPITAGAALSADASSAEHQLQGLYLLPGVALTSAAHIVRKEGQDVVLPWREFQHVAKSLCENEGEGAIPLFTINREEFSRHLLVDHLGCAGDRPNVAAFRAAFARSLKLNKDVDDLSETLRLQLIEARPTNVRAFRERVDQFRGFRDIIARLKVQLGRACEVVDKYAVVKRERTRQANLKVLDAVLRTEALGETLGTEDDKRRSYEALRETSKRALEEMGPDITSAEDELLRSRVARESDPDFRAQAGHAERLKDLEEDANRGVSVLQGRLAELRSGLEAAGRLPSLATHMGTFEVGLKKVVDLERQLKLEKSVPAEAIHATALTAAQAYSLVRRAQSEAEANEQAALDVRQDAKRALERAVRGLAPLRDGTLKLQRLLDEAGIPTTPICDLVSVSDLTWQPVLEAYLGPHVDALLVPRPHEIHAIDLYRGLKGEQRVYGVKLALPSRVRDWRAPSPGKYASDLLEGDATAVGYLRGELGRTQLAMSSADLRAGERALSQEGMIATGGGVERRRLPGADELKMGRRDGGQRREVAEAALRAAESRLAEAQQIARALTSVERLFAPFGNSDRVRDEVNALWVALVEVNVKRDHLRDALAATATPGLKSLDAAVESALSRVKELRQRREALAAEVNQADGRLSQLLPSLEALRNQLLLAQADERITRQSPWYDANEVDRWRNHFDAKYGEDEAAKRRTVVEKMGQAGNAAERADREAWSLFAQYAADYNSKNHDIASDQWERAYDFVLKEQTRITDLELVEQESRAEEAYQAAVRVFRTDVAQALLAGFDRIKEQITGLNQVLKHAPAFSNNERYQFKYKVVDEHKVLFDFLKRIREHGDEEDDIFGGSGKVPGEFRAILEGEVSAALLDSSPLHDHRRFYSFDVEIFQGGNSIGWLSKRLGPGSGGEHRTPLYVIFGAALAAAYGAASGAPSGVMMLDEAFEKMDPQNVRATADYLNALGLQLVMAGPEADQPKMSSFLSIYYDMARFGSRTVQFTKNVVRDEARALLESDNYLLHPELLEEEIGRLRATETSIVDAPV